MPEFIRDGETGFVFDSIDELPAILRRLVAEPALVDRMGKRAREVVMSEFDLRVAGARMWDVYATLLKAQTRRVA